MLNHNDHRVPSSAIRRDFGRLFGVAGLVLAASAFIAPPLAGALRLADQHFAAQAVLSQESFIASPRMISMAEAGR